MVAGVMWIEKWLCMSGICLRLAAEKMGKMIENGLFIFIFIFNNRLVLIWCSVFVYIPVFDSEDNVCGLMSEI